jgi:nucleoside-diphosphate-sugar epimerase
MSDPKHTVVVTGAAGNLGLRLLPLLSDFSVYAVDVNEPATELPMKFERMDLGQDASRDQLVKLLRDSGASSVVHLAFIIDPVMMGVLDVDRMWQINVAGTVRVIDAISEVNRTGGNIRKFIYPSSVSAYGSETPGPVTEDFPLGAHTLPYAVHKREAEKLVQSRATGMGACSTYILRPHIYAGASMQNYLIGALRGTPSGRGRLAGWLRRKRVRLPLVLPYGRKPLDKKFQFVHVDDVARLIAWIVSRQERGPEMVILNVPGSGPALSLRRCIEIAQATVVPLPAEIFCRWTLRLMWNLGISGVPPEALPYMIGSYTMDSTRLRAFLGDEYDQVIQFSVEQALADSFRTEASAKPPAFNVPAATPR